MEAPNPNPDPAAARSDAGEELPRTRVAGTLRLGGASGHLPPVRADLRQPLAGHVGPAYPAGCATNYPLLPPPLHDQTRRNYYVPPPSAYLDPAYPAGSYDLLPSPSLAHHSSLYTPLSAFPDPAASDVYGCFFSSPPRSHHSSLSGYADPVDSAGSEDYHVLQMQPRGKHLRSLPPHGEHLGAEHNLILPQPRGNHLRSLPPHGEHLGAEHNLILPQPRGNHLRSLPLHGEHLGAEHHGNAFAAGSGYQPLISARAKYDGVLPPYSDIPSPVVGGDGFEPDAAAHFSYMGMARRRETPPWMQQPHATPTSPLTLSFGKMLRANADEFVPGKASSTPQGLDLQEVRLRLLSGGGVDLQPLSTKEGMKALGALLRECKQNYHALQSIVDAAVESNVLDFAFSRLNMMKLLLGAVADHPALLKILLEYLVRSQLVQRSQGVELLKYCVKTMNYTHYKILIQHGVDSLRTRTDHTRRMCDFFIECFNCAEHSELLDFEEVMVEHAVDLALGPYSNYVIQHVLKQCEYVTKWRIVEQLMPQVLRLCLDEHGGYLVQSCFKQAYNAPLDGEILPVVLDAVLGLGTQELAQMVTGDHSHWVILELVGNKSQNLQKARVRMLALMISRLPEIVLQQRNARRVIVRLPATS